MQRRFRSWCATLVLTALAPGCSNSVAGAPRVNAYGGGYPVASAAPLTGGVTDDNARLPEYLAYVNAYPHGDVPKLDLTDRRVITVLDGEGLPRWDVGVRVDGGGQPGYRARTNSAGQFILPSAALRLEPRASLYLTDEDGSTVGLGTGGDVVAFPAQRRPIAHGVPVDIALVVDTTGSMADEVERLRTTLKSVVAQVASHPARPSVRIGGVAYRDVGEPYVVQPFPFTSDLGQVQRTLDGLRASGGGDGPEAVQEALERAVHGLAWGGPGTVRLLFLIGDAPPHFERGTPYTQTMRDAVERGITIVPVACSGMDDTGEFVWRQLAAVTLGSFLFVSYGGGTDHHTGPYEENDLDALMVRAVWQALDAITQAGAQGRVCPCQPMQTQAPIPPAQVVSQGRVGYGRSPWDFGIPGWTR